MLKKTDPHRFVDVISMNFEACPMTTPATSIYLSTLRIQALDSSMRIFGLGTGYFYDFPIGDAHIPVLITNKHVINDAASLRLAVQVMPSGGTVKVDGSAEGERTV
jgi:hypothetical protein